MSPSKCAPSGGGCPHARLSSFPGGYDWIWMIQRLFGKLASWGSPDLTGQFQFHHWYFSFAQTDLPGYDSGTINLRTRLRNKHERSFPR